MNVKGALLAAVLLLCLLLLSGCRQLHPLPPLDDITYDKAGPSEVNALTIGTSIKGLSFVDAQGNPFSLPEKTPLVLVYWASWGLASGEALPRVDALAQSVAQAGGTLLLINKTDGIEETRETALAWLEEAGVVTMSVFDMEDAAFVALHMDYVPTTLVVDTGGTITSFVSGGVPEEAALLSMLAEAKAGKTAWMQGIITSLLMGDDGGIHTSYLPEDARPSGEDVLSESQGLMMRYAAGAGDAALFDSAWQYALSHQTDGGLVQWVSNDTDEDSTVNATLDDLRICRALLESDGRSVAGMAMAKAMRRYVAPNDRLEDFYDFGLRQHAGQLTLCYADFEALEMLAYRDSSWKPILNNALAVVTNGRISDAFPLYHSRYSYAAGTYASDTLHMAEALLTLQHLAAVDRLPPDAYGWLRDRLLVDGRLYTRYTVEGAPATDGLFESSAVYAVAAQIALLQDDLPLARVALTKMEALRVREAGSAFDGALGNADGTGIHSFDQLKALLAYQAFDGSLAGD